MGLISWVVDKKVSLLESELKNLKSELSILRQEVDIINTNVHNLRGWLNRKLATFKDDDNKGDSDIKEEIETLKAFFGTPVQNYNQGKDLIDTQEY